uniref:Uncharacterized protein n=1 Tax=Rhipicephalus zambeziensis TaxID=60191 RepID=A0A224Y5S3_9ACAR
MHTYKLFNKSETSYRRLLKCLAHSFTITFGVFRHISQAQSAKDYHQCTALMVVRYNEKTAVMYRTATLILLAEKNVWLELGGKSKHFTCSASSAS